MKFFRMPMGLLPRIYLVGVIQILLVGVSLMLARDLLRNESWRNRFDDELSYFVDEWSALRDTPAELQASLERAQQRMGMRVTLRDAEGTLLGNTRPDPAPPLRPEELSAVSSRVTRSGPRGPFPGAGSGPGRMLVVSPFPGPIQVYAAVSLPPPPPPPDGDRQTAIIVGLVLACTAITSVVFARTLAGPLEKLASAARAFGAGRLDVRAGLRRKDELGLVSEAFDEMAGRITQLLRSQKELLANVSHELRTPLSRIRVALDLAAEGDAQTARELLPDITEDLSELERLVSDVLTTSRLELVTEGASGVPPLRLERVDANALLDKAAARFHTARPTHRLEVQVDGTLPALEADPVLLRRVLDNLLDNAGKYSEPGTTVKLHARAAGDGLQVDIQDQGIGIEAQDLSRVGTPFFRTDRSRARTTGGVGLGLALVRRILDAHHGRLTLESQPGQGTTARIVLPGVGAADTPDGRLAAGHLS
ncbi:HAMP domain-containing histidine kinase [Corallococcus exiguus]|uniref:histidine kinase n=1 Tax=Corallococcus exiguus TaxID=83462 RepID=A0A7X4YI72_9BACT|nr:HAMP domain-containing sensor histidine kinase [Corallococcus exiguus]NBC45745.1 HAMP domain-containing protein [Corallococcus exiguus]NNC09226.1 HAMP domain-containing histidine kinase [Corallococcus exiguus]TNV55274.1 HAMP domain-containing histidine kinase [Corallococcus exiguus]